MPTNSATTFADGMAVRVPDATALDLIRRGSERIVEVCDDEIAEAIRILYSASHACAEGAGAAALAALIKERDRMRGRRVAVIVTGQNIDRAWMQIVLAGGTPRVESRSNCSMRTRSEQFGKPAKLIPVEVGDRVVRKIALRPNEDIVPVARALE